MTSAIFGYTGFVGSNLTAQYEFDNVFNTSNSMESAGKDYDFVVFAAAKAEKWRINKYPAADIQHIQELEGLIAGVRAKQFVLISTVDVYISPNGVDEATEIATDGLSPYGAHRYRLEEFVRAQHPGALVVRLPGLFAAGLKKNVIFDLLTNNNVERIHADSTFQYYNLEHLWSDIQIALAHDLLTVNLTSEPIRTGDLVRAAFGYDFDNRPDDANVGSYDMQTNFAELFGGSGSYTRSRDQTIAEITSFVRREQGR
ncbi:pyridine nucleotide transhydrogenase [Cryobacterium glaciale]|uniref:Pyridine nucleotide transhydrogenase n=1 Tax=Cryobacterium glaciale TaxID=1259145 RepID=A0A4R8UYJ4_9MICO|nr:pyridine nucleotide transhydrogenase [Cryobacterium glaciale]TFB74350.1 pyridine nucleotide transhydrogenase [Cryobacterium glaciale]